MTFYFKRAKKIIDQYSEEEGNIVSLSGNFVQRKSEEHNNSDLVYNPFVKLSTADKFVLSENKIECLSQIIAEIKSKVGETI